ncbi:hypothetical protein ACFFX0_20240 [Citricoccus parietis]|uniref:Uncharacterized protein n=1 Tax=Citricoccus parietis TaxID=592307 RepID=A0ABV5G394_9MICC
MQSQENQDDRQRNGQGTLDLRRRHGEEEHYRCDHHGPEGHGGNIAAAPRRSAGRGGAGQLRSGRTRIGQCCHLRHVLFLRVRTAHRSQHRAGLPRRSGGPGSAW